MKKLYLMIVLIMMLTVSIIPIYANDYYTNDDYNFTNITNNETVYVVTNDINFSATPVTVQFKLLGSLSPSQTPQQLLNTINSSLSVNDVVVINLPGAYDTNISRVSLIDPLTGYVEINYAGMIQIKKASEYLYLAIYHNTDNNVLTQIRIPNEDVIYTNFNISISRVSPEGLYEEGYQKGYNDARELYGILYEGEWLTADEYAEIQYNIVYNERYQEGYDEQYPIGFADGETDGATEGYNDGYQEGLLIVGSDDLLSPLLIPLIIIVVLGSGIVVIIKFAIRGDE